MIISGKTTEVLNTIFIRRPPTYMLHYVLGNQPQGSNRTYTLAFVVTIYTIVRYRDRSWYMSELADGEANLVCWDFHGNRRHAWGV